MLSSSAFTTPDLETNIDDQAHDHSWRQPKPKRPPDTSASKELPNPPSLINYKKIRRRRLSVTFADEIHHDHKEESSKHSIDSDSTRYSTYAFFPSPLATAPIPASAQEAVALKVEGLGLRQMPIPVRSQRAKSDDEIVRTSSPVSDLTKVRRRAVSRPEHLVLGVLWMMYITWLANV